MDMEKIETEFEFYNFRLESLKKECKCTSLCFIHYQQSLLKSLNLFMLDERAFRLHTKRMVEKFTQNVVDAAERELPAETALRIKSISDVTMNLIKPDIMRFLSKSNALIDKYLSIPADLIIDEEKCMQNTPDMDNYEMQCKKDFAELELVYKQQALMINHLKAELDLYDNELMAEAEIDMSMCDLLEENFGECDDSSGGGGDSINSSIHDSAVASVLGELSGVGIELN